MKKKIIVIISGVIIAAVLALGVVPVAADAVAASQTTPAAMAARPGRALARLLLIQDEAKVDALLAKGVAAGKITADQSAQIKAFWTAHHAEAIKTAILGRLLRVRDEAKLKSFLDKAVANGKITADQEAKIIEAWEAVHTSA
jgi:hypothetical protein